MEGIIIILVIVTFSVVFFIERRLTVDRYNRSRMGIIVIPCHGEMKNLEKIVKSCYWEEIFESEQLGRTIALVQMDSENTDISKSLAQKYSIVDCVDISQLTEYLKIKTEKH